MTNFVNYYRVSTRQQGDSGLGLESQKAMLSHFQAGHNVTHEFTEVASAKNVTERPILQQAIALCLEHGYTLAVAKVDRLSRLTEDALAIHAQLDGRMFSADIPQENGKMDKFILTIFMAIADRERELIGLRTKAALQAKKERGEKLGNPANFTASGRAKGSQAMADSARGYWQVDINYISILRGQGLGYKLIADTLNNDGRTSRKGGKFYATTVKRIIDREAKAKAERGA